MVLGAAICFIGINLYLAMMDFKERRLPNWATFVFIITGLASSFISGNVVNPLLTSLGLMLIFLVFALKGLIAGGDMKMAMGLGMWLGYPASLYVLTCACFLALITTMIMYYKKGELKQVIFLTSVGVDEIDQQQSIPFGTYMAICSIIYILI